MDITPDILLQAYAAGIFPMAEDRDSDALNWYDPPLRGIIPLDGMHIPRSLAKTLRQEKFTVTVNAAFAAVVAGCASAGMSQAGLTLRDDTWISPAIAALYKALHASGHAHSLEVWQDDNATGLQLVGGLYGVALGRAFFGESMFSRVRDASKVALAHLLARLIRQGFTLCDTQYLTDHLARFGGVEIPRASYKSLLANAISQPAQFASVSSGIASSAAGADAGGTAVAALLAGVAAAGAGSTFTGCSQSTTLMS